MSFTDGTTSDNCEYQCHLAPTAQQEEIGKEVNEITEE